MLNNPISQQQVACGDQASVVADLSRDLGNGELRAWIELDHQSAGLFCTVPIRAKLIALQRRVDVMGALAAAAPEVPVFANNLAEAKMDLLNFNATNTVAA